MKLTELKKLEGNPRTIKKEDLDKLTKSIEKFGVIEGRPFLVSNRTGENIIIGGNQRYEVCKKLGIKEVPVHIMEGLSEEEEKEIIIRDNISNGEWDWDILANEWDKEELEEWGLDVQFETVEPEAEEDDFEVDEGIKTDIVLGDLFEIGEHRLLCGDSTNIDDVNKLMNGEKADMVFTDPPYGVSYTGGHNKKQRKGIENDTLQGDDLTNLFRDSLLNADIVSKDHTAFYIWYANGKAVETFKSFSELDLEVRAVICWYKVKSGLGAFMSQYIPNYEPCIYAFKKGKTCQWFGPTDEKSVWEQKKESKNTYHPTQKPVELAERATKNSSEKGNIVLDLFGGSGSTMVACHQLNRKCYMSELDPKYVQTIINRMIKLDPTLEIKRNGQPYASK